MRYLAILFGFLLIKLDANSQIEIKNTTNPLEDSLLILITKEKNDSLRADYYLSLANNLRRNNPEKAIYYGGKALEIYRNKNQLVGIGKSYLHIGTGFLNSSLHTEAYSNFKNSILFGLKANDLLTVARAYNNIGIIYIKQGNNAEALKHYIKGLEIRKEAGDTIELASSYVNIGNVYYYEKNYDESKKNYELAAKIFKKSGNKFGLSNALSNLGNFYMQTGDWELSLEYFNQALNLQLASNDIRSMASTYHHLGELNMRMQNYITAKDYFKKSLKFSLLSQNKELTGESMMNLATVDLRLNKIDEAEQKLLEAKKQIETFQNIKTLSQCYYFLSQVDSIRGNYKSSLANYKVSVRLNDSTINKENSDIIAQTRLLTEFNKKQDEIREKQYQKDLLAQAEINRQKSITYLSLTGGIIILIFLGISIRAYNGKRKANKIISEQKSEVEKQKHLLDVRQKEIVDSINYAKRIQYALLANEELIRTQVKDHFIFFKPKDIVSGDFYWSSEFNNKFYLACFDCTGHGVPGAFMSLLNIGFLSEAIKEKNIESPSSILNYVRERLIENISKEGQKDGMDGALICIDKKSNQIQYAAAYNSPILIRNNNLVELDADKMPIGIGERPGDFRNFTLDVKEGDILYLYTDGYADQFGGPKGKKFKYRPLNDLLLKYSQKSFTEQKFLLENEFEAWKGNLEQIDDVLVLGIKI